MFDPWMINEILYQREIMENKNTIENGNSKLMVPRRGELLQSDLFGVVLRHRWIILGATVAFLAVGFLYILNATPIYTSTARLYVEQSGPKIISEYEGVMTQSKNYLYTQSELIKSTPIIYGAVDDKRIRELKTFANIDNSAGYVKKALKVLVGRKDDIIAVSCDSPYPAEAAQLVNAVVDSYIEYHSTRRRSTVSEVLRILQKEKVKRDEELSGKFTQLLDFTRDNGVISFDNSGGHIVFQKLRKLSEALTDVQLVNINTKADYEAIKSMMDEPAKIKQFAMAQPSAGVRVFINDVESQLKSELKDMEVELEGLRLQCTEDHPSVRAIRAKIEYTKQQLNQQAQRFAEAYLQVMKLRFETAKQRETELQTSFDGQQMIAQGLSVKAAEYSVMQSELKRTERLCEILDDRIKELNVTEDVGALNISILEVGRPSGRPSKPQRAKVMAIALAFGLMFGGGLAFVRDWMDHRLRSAEEVSGILGVPILGTVPAMSKKVGIVARGQKVHLDSKSLVAEAYRTIRTAVFFGVPKDEAKTILVTSPAPGDGKSTLVSNLAITMAQAGQKTLVIDCDFRKPKQHSIFEIDEGIGIADVLAGTVEMAEAIQTGPVENLALLACGQEVPNPSEMLNSETFAKTLNTLSKQYDRVIIDSPPVAPVADSQILGAICDVTLLVLRAEKSTRKHSQQARDGLLSVGAHVLGAIVNDVHRNRERYGYYSGYGYRNYGYYGYGSGNEEKKKESVYV